MRKFVSSISTLAAILMLAQPVLAGERAGAVSVSPFVGGYTFDGEQHLETAPVYGLRLGYDFTKYFGVEAVGNYLATQKSSGGDRSVNAVSYRLDFLYNLMPDGPLVPYLAAGGGGTTIGHGGDFDTRNGNDLLYQNQTSRNTAPTANVGGGLKYFLSDSVALRADARQLFVFGKKTLYNWEYTAGLSFLFGGMTPAPVAKAAPAPAPAPEAKPIAPAPPAPPTSTLAATPTSIKKGESATLAWSSQNATDCTLEPAIGKVQPQGSMAVTPVDSTSYTLSCSGPGGTTTCATQVAVALPIAPPQASLTAIPATIAPGEKAKLQWSSQEANNCDMQPGIGAVQPQGSIEVTPQSDTAYTLNCAGDGGTAKASTKVVVAAPAPAPAPTPEQLCVTLNINFATGKAEIPAKYREDLAKIAKFMKEYPQVKGVIEGHTDNVGSKALNEKLSQRRAQSVKNYLVKEFGVEPSRLGVKGYGFAKPVADNATAAGRQQNRRIVANFDCVQK
ncbi:OmpA family protein [Geomonas sp. RF6]|uniref:OmpA family protein n=1 Tax=Geomonas sp. RF6 TaxID=2897342 RepID=UPI001E659AB7|nr:OmpA family protein [Geomonas sp. RF6]UFS71189.1 OmpA family protein [Geomonas sp. RF6]